MKRLALPKHCLVLNPEMQHQIAQGARYADGHVIGVCLRVLINLRDLHLDSAVALHQIASSWLVDINIRRLVEMVFAGACKCKYPRG